MGLTRSNVFPSKYLGKDDVFARPVRSAVGDVRIETIKGDHADEDKAVLVFSDRNIKPMILNSTNWDTLESAYGADTDGWLGKPVEAYLDPGVVYAGKRVGGVRLRIPAGTAVNPSGNGNGGRGLWTLDMAVAEAANAGRSREDLIAALKARGLNGYNAARDTATAQAVIAEWTQPATEGFGDPPGTQALDENGNVIPF